MSEIIISKIDYYLPEKVIKTNEITNLGSNWTSEKIENKIGIKERRITDKNETAIDLAEKACKKLFRKIKSDKVNGLILCSQSPKYLLPSSSCILQKKLNLNTNIMCFDFNLGCSGYIYGLAIASSLIRSNLIENCVLVTCDTYSKYIDSDDWRNRVIFGDGATASFIEKSNNKSILEFVFGTDGSGAEDLIVKGGVFENEFLKPKLFMNGHSIYEFTIKKIPNLVYQTLEKNNISITDIDFFIFHQANKYILEQLRKILKIDKDKFIYNFENFGNTVSSSIPIVLSNKLKNDILNLKNKNIMLVGFGVGLSWGAVVIKY